MAMTMIDQNFKINRHERLQLHEQTLKIVRLLKHSCLFAKMSKCKG